jgi:hypothetical protein
MHAHHWHASAFLILAWPHEDANLPAGMPPVVSDICRSYSDAERALRRCWASGGTEFWYWIAPAALSFSSVGSPC